MAEPDLDQDEAAETPEQQAEEDRAGAEEAERVLHAGPPSLLDFISPAMGGGRVVNEMEARDSPCLCRELQREGGGTSDVCFSRGVVGALSREQEDLYCSAGREVLPATEAEQARLQAMSQASHSCRGEVAELPKGQRFDPYVTCMQRELRRHGQAP